MSETKRIYLCLAHMSEAGLEQKYIQEAFDTNWVVPNATNLKPFDRLKGKANAIVEVVVDGLTIVVMIDGMAFVIPIQGTAIRYSCSFVAIANYRNDIHPRQNGDFVARIDGQGCVIMVNVRRNLAGPPMFRRLVDKVQIKTQHGNTNTTTKTSISLVD